MSREIKAIEQIIGSVAAAHAGDDGAVRIGECSVKISEALFGGSGKEERAALLSICTEMGSKAERRVTARGRDRRAQALRKGGGRNNADADSRSLCNGTRGVNERHGLECRGTCLPRLAAGDERRGPGEKEVSAGAGPGTVCVPPGAMTSSSR